MRRLQLFFLIFFLALSGSQAQEIGVLKYKGGGDWYSNPTALPNLISFCNQNIGTALFPQPVPVEPGSSDIFRFPFIHMTGHGNVFFNEEEVENLRNYLLSGGFLHIDDNYGMNEYIRRELKKLFPDRGFQKYTNTTASGPRLLVFLRTTACSVSLPMKAIWAMAGKMLKSITIPWRCAKKPCRWELTSLNTSS